MSSSGMRAMPTCRILCPFRTLQALQELTARAAETEQMGQTGKDGVGIYGARFQ
jgi:hypothetical protein